MVAHWMMQCEPFVATLETDMTMGLGLAIIAAVVILVGVTWTTINDLEKSDFHDPHSEDKHD